MCALGDTFQAKVDNMLIDIKSLKTYSNDILVLRKDILSKHLNQMRIIFGRLCAADLKVNAPKCSFGFKKIPYLGYVITQEGIKPDPRKVKGSWISGELAP